MTFSVLPDATPLADLMAKLADADPYSGPDLVSDHEPYGVVRVGPFASGVAFDSDAMIALGIWERSQVQRVLECLESNLGHLILVSDTLSQKPVSPDILRYIHYSRLKYGIFASLDYHLADLRPYQGATIFVPDTFAAAILKLASQPRKGGRPTHPAKAWYEAQGFERRSRSMKELQREMESAYGPSPSAATIRAWEKKARGT